MMHSETADGPFLEFYQIFTKYYIMEAVKFTVIPLPAILEGFSKK